MFCLLPQFAEKIKKTIKDGHLNPDVLNNMTSSERRGFLEDIVGKENAKEVNLLFEKKLLLKNQEKAMYDWVREITGMSKADKEEILSKIRQTIADKNRRIYEPSENEKFLNEIASNVYSKKYKTDISLEEAQTITELTQDLKEATDKVTDKTKITPESIDAGSKLVALNNYTNALKAEANKKEWLNPFKEKDGVKKIEAVIEDARISANFIADNSRALVAGVLDNSFFGNQGAAVLMDPRTTHIWWNNLVKSVKDIRSTIKSGVSQGDAIVDAAKAMTYAEPNYMNGRYENKGGTRLEIWKGEEEITSDTLYKIPGLNRLAKAADVAYEVGAVRTRVEVANKLYKLFEDLGYDLNDKSIISGINKEVNAMTGRGDIGVLNKVSKQINTIFFSIRFLKSTFDVATAHILESDVPTAVKIDSAKKLLRIYSTAGVILAIASALGRIFGRRDTVETNPLSSDFLKIKIGNTRIGIPFVTRVGSLITLMARIAFQKTKSTTTGITTKLGTGYGAKTGMDIFWDFTENKFSPLLSVIKDIASQQTFEGKKPTILGEVGALTIPMGASSVAEIWKDKTLNPLMKVLVTAVNYFGIPTQSYSSETDWGENAGVELTQFKNKVGQAKFKEANDKYNQTYNDWLSGVKNNPKYTSLTSEQKQSILSSKKASIKEQIFRQYGFKYIKTKNKPLPKL